jgi:hypothetical protein
VVSGHDPKQGHELSGFGGFQGFHDMLSGWTNDASHNIVRNVQKELAHGGFKPTSTGAALPIARGRDKPRIVGGN